MAIYSPFTDYLPPLRRGDKGIEVSALQRALREIGRSTFTFEYTTVSDTGVFDLATETAVKALQRTWNLRVDGIADRDVQRAVYLSQTTLGHFRDLSVLSNPRIRHIIETLGSFPNAGETPRPASSQTVSYAAKEWMFFDETGDVLKAGAYLHYPGTKDKHGNSSGVTLGPGYDMGYHSEEEIVTMLTRIGVDKKVASQVGTAAHNRTGADAEQYVAKNGINGTRLIELSKAQQVLMQNLYLPNYEGIVRKRLTAPVLQREYEALVSLTANPSYSIASVVNLLNQGRVAAALEDILNRIHVGPSILCGIIARRRREVEWFVSGRYTRASCGVAGGGKK